MLILRIIAAYAFVCGVVIGSAAAQTATASAKVPAAAFSSVVPSANFRTADLGVMRIDRPENWQVFSSRQDFSATIAPRAGASGSAVAYGVVIQPLEPDPSMSLQQLTAAFIESLQRDDSNMKRVGDIQVQSVNGKSVSSVELETISPMADSEGKPQRERDWLVTMPRGRGDAVFVVFVSTLARFDQLRPTFDRMLRSIQF